MYRLVKTVIKALSLLGGFALVAATTLLPETINLPFSRVTGFIEAYNELESEALSLIPDEVEAFVSRLYKALN